jgi:hypothetical protein
LVAAFPNARRYSGEEDTRARRARVALLSSNRSMMSVDTDRTRSFADGRCSIADSARDRYSAFTASRLRPHVRISDRSHGFRNRVGP